MNLKDLRDLIELIRGTEVTEIELTEGDFRVRLKRGETPQLSTVLAPMTPSPQRVQPPTHADGEPEAHVIEDQKCFSVRSPIVGTFYRSSSPDAEPYVDVGTTVKKGQVLCIVEAMKLMNEIESELEGRVLEICKEDGSAAEFGEVLFKIEPIALSGEAH